MNDSRVSFPFDDSGIPGTDQTKWDAPPRSIKSRMGRRQTQREESYNQRFLAQLRKAFDKADPGETGYLTQSRWDSSSIRELLHDGTLTQNQFHTYFKRIDATSEGRVTWNKLVYYLLKEISASDYKKSNEAIQFIRKWRTAPHMKNQTHREMVCQIACSYRTNEYITVSSDSIRFWNSSDLTFKRSILEPGLFSRVLVFETLGTIAITTNNRKMFFYELDFLNKLPPEIGASPTARSIKYMSEKDARNALSVLSSKKMPMFNNPKCLAIAENSIIDSTYVPFFVGDDQGLIEMYHLIAPKRRSGVDFGIERVSRFPAHAKAVTQISTITPMLYASSGLDHRVVFFTFNTVTKKFNVTQVFTDTEPIVSFYYNISQKYLATCGISREAYIWSHETGKKVFKLGGHYNQLWHLTNYITTTNETYILTMTNKKEFRLWDSVNYRLMKEWSDPTIFRPENRFGAAFFDPKRHQLITAASFPMKWCEDASALIDSMDEHSHNYPIIGVFFSDVFNQIVSVDSRCCIKAWDIFTGRTESSHMERWTSESSELASATLDSGKRALITSTFMNDVISWNFNSGSIISNLGLDPVKNLVSVVKCFNIGGKDILVRAGWDKVINLYLEVESCHYELFRSFYGHSSDISTVCAFSQGVVSSSVNGEIFSWVLDNNAPYGGAKLYPETCVECMASFSNTLFVGDSLGNLHIMALPKLQKTITTRAHEIVIRYSITAMVVDEENCILYTADTLGYVKKWKIEDGEIANLIPVDIYRLHRDEITGLTLALNGKYLATTGSDLCIRLFLTEGMVYIGLFCDENQWKLNDDETWIKDPPFFVEPQHFQIGQNVASGVLMSGSVVGMQLLLQGQETTRSTSSMSVGSTKSTNLPTNRSRQTSFESIAEVNDDEEEPVDFQKIHEALKAAEQEPAQYIPRSLLFHEEEDDKDKPPRYEPFKRESLGTAARPVELMSTIRNLIDLDAPPKPAPPPVKLPIVTPNKKRRGQTSHRMKSFTLY